MVGRGPARTGACGDKVMGVVDGLAEVDYSGIDLANGGVVTATGNVGQNTTLAVVKGRHSKNNLTAKEVQVE